MLTQLKIAAQDTSYSTAGAFSLVKGAWEDNHRKIKLYNRLGEVTYTLEEVNSSYRVSVELKKNKLGTVDYAVIHTNPGASRYQFVTTIWFGADNQPRRKEYKRIPTDFLHTQTSQQWLWSAKKKCWVVQETAECQPYQSTNH